MSAEHPPFEKCPNCGRLAVLSQHTCMLEHQLDQMRHARDRVLDELRERNEELRVVWHAMACPFDHCERCIEDADVIKRIRFRLGPAT